MTKKENREAKSQEKALMRKGIPIPNSYLARIKEILPPLSNPECLEVLSNSMRYRSKVSGIFTEEAVKELTREPVEPAYESQAQVLTAKLAEQQCGDVPEIAGLIASIPDKIKQILRVDHTEDIGTRKRRIAYARWVHKNK